MKAKLIKINGEYLLNPTIVGTKLSLKNCQAIELGYDLDELIDKYCRGNSKIEDDFIKKGFQKALEILGDKKFSEDDMRKAFDTNHLSSEHKESQWVSFIQSVQQTEWDVEIVEEDNKVVESHVWDGSNDGELTWKKQPLFDAGGCLILKRK